MTRVGKQQERRNKCPRKRTPLFAEKTGSKKDHLPKGYKEHSNALEDQGIFIAKIK